MIYPHIRIFAPHADMFVTTAYTILRAVFPIPMKYILHPMLDDLNSHSQSVCIINHTPAAQRQVLLKYIYYLTVLL